MLRLFEQLLFVAKIDRELSDRLLGLGLGACLDFGLRFENPLFDGKIEFAPCLGQLALFAHGLGLRLLRLGQLGFPLVERLGQLFELLLLVD